MTIVTIINRTIISAAAIILFTSAAWAGTFTVDPVYTTIHFRIKHIMGFAVGSFEKFNGTINLNDANDTLKDLEATVDVASLNTRNAERDTDLRSEKFFDAAKFPQAKFVGKKITKDKITGDLTLHGVTKEATFDYTLFGVAMDQHGRTKVALSLKGTINRKDFGIVYNTKTDDGTWLLGDDVDLMIEVEGILQK